MNPSEEWAQMHNRQKAFAILFCITSSLYTVVAAKAAEVYTYTGNDYQLTCNYDNGNCDTPTDFNTSEFISGEITLSSALGDSSSIAYTPAVSYSFFDGINTWTSANSIVEYMDLGTDAAGNINDWQIELYKGGTDGYIMVTCGGGNLTLASCTSAGGPEDFADFLTNDGFNYGLTPNNPGTWVASVAQISSTPEPSSFTLIALGSLLALGVGIFRRASARA